MEVFAASFLSGAGEIFPFLILRNVTLSLRSGNSPEAAFAYAAFGMLLCGSLDAPAIGERWGRLAVAMNEKLDDYFSAGTELVWIVDPVSKSIRVFTSREHEVTLGVDETLDGGAVLLGFSVPVADVFNAAD